MGVGVKGFKEKVSQFIIIIFLLILSLLVILPFLLLLSSSLTTEKSLFSKGFNLITTDFSLYAYKYLFQLKGVNILKSYGITLFITVFGTGLSLLIAPLLAYPISRRDYPRRKIVTLLIVFTLLFNGGVVPSYLMWTHIFHIRNTLWALVFPNLLFNGFYILLYKNSFATNIHPALIEAAKIDGAGEIYIYRKIILPLSAPILATVGLMVGLGYWNDWINGLYYIGRENLYSFQLLLIKVMNDFKALNTISYYNSMDLIKTPNLGMFMAMAVINVVPIIILYPFFQRYFIEGITICGVKG